MTDDELWQVYEERQAQRANRYDDSGNYVPAAIVPAREPIRAYPVQSVDVIDVPAPVQARATITGTYTDRAKAFNHKVTALSTVTAAGFALVAVAGFGVPVLSLGTLAAIAAGYFVTWAGAYALDAFTSAEGTAFFHTLRAWRWLDREQAHRHYLELRRNFPEDYE